MGSAARSVYRHADLVRLLHPRSVAIVGASPRPGSFGQRLEANLAGFDGEVLLVNGKYDRIGERACHPSLKALPAVPDCVVIATSRDAVEPVLREAIEVGAGGAIVFASGYSETGKAESERMQRDLARIAAESGVRLVGPNCIGLSNFVVQANMTFGPVPQGSRPRSPSIGIVSQSGAVGQGLMQAIEHGTSISHVLTSGNSADVDVADLVSYLADDPACEAIACVFEGLREPLRMVEAAGIARAAGKPLIIYKMATGESGAAAAMSHTGSLAGSDRAYQAAFRQAGAMVVERIEDLVETATFFAKAPRPAAAGAAVVSTSGGGAVICADKAEIHGVDLPQPGPEAEAVLKARIPDFGSHRNPCDITAQVLNDPESLSACMNALMGDPAFGVVVHPHPVAYAAATPRIAALGETAARHGKFACVVWMNQWLEGPGAREAETNPKVALFRSMDSCFNAIAEWNRREAARGRPADAPVAVAGDVRAAARRQVAHASAPVLTEKVAKPILASYGVPVVGERLVASVEEAVAAAAALGYPLAVKVESKRIPHKTDAGVVRLSIRGEAELREAHAAVMANALKVASAADIDGVLVQPMAPPGVEIMIGGRVDPLFGPLVVVGIGGVMVELLKDTALALAPVGARDAADMIRGLRHARLLSGFRGTAPVDVEALAQIVARVSSFIADTADLIEEIDINPLICAGNSIVAVDALIVRRDAAAEGRATAA